jgi:hypothetical protein
MNVIVIIVIIAHLNFAKKNAKFVINVWILMNVIVIIVIIANLNFARKYAIYVIYVN